MLKQKNKRIVFIAIAFLIFGYLLLTVLGSHFYQTQLTYLIKKQTGLDLSIKGPCRLRLYPLAIHAQKVIISDQILSIDSIKLPLSFTALIKRQFKLTHLELKGLFLHLIRYQDGSFNWQPPQKAAAFAKPGPLAKTSAPPFFNVQIKKGTLFYEDRAQNHCLYLENVQLERKANVLKGVFDLKLARPNQPPYVKSQGVISQNPILTLDLKGNLPQHQAKITLLPNPAALEAHLNLKTAKTKLEGQAFFPWAKKPFRFLLNADKIYIDKKPSPKGPTSFSSTFSPRLSFCQRPLEGALIIKELFIQKLHLKDVKANIKKEKTYELSAKLYQGTLLAKADANEKKTTVKGKLSNIALAPFLKDLAYPVLLSGQADIDFTVDTPDILGSSQFQVTKGALHGLDANYYFSLAKALIKKRPIAPNTRKTPFDTLKGTLNWTSMQISTPDWVLLSPEIKIHGKGHINPKEQSLSYQLKAWQQPENPAHWPLAIQIKGPLSAPRIQPDIEHYLKLGLRQQDLSTKVPLNDLKARLNQALKKRLKL